MQRPASKLDPFAGVCYKRVSNKRGMMKTASALWGMLVGLCLATTAFADTVHYNDNLVGERAAGMGGAFCAIADEPTAAYYNPAGLVDIEEDYFSLSGSMYQYRVREQSSITGGKKLSSSSINIIPTASGTVWHFLDKHRWAFNVFVPEYNDSLIEFDDASQSPEYHLDNHQQVKETLAGPSLSFALHPGVQVGISLFLYYRQLSEQSSSLVRTTDGIFYNSELSQDSKLLGLLPVGGILFKPTDWLNLGFSLRAGFRTWGFTNYRKVYTTNQGDSANNYSFIRSDKTESGVVPFSFRAGAAFAAWPGGQLSVDLSMHDKYRAKTLYGEINYNIVPNTHVGLRQMITPDWSFLAGFYTDLTAAPRHRITSEFTDEERQEFLRTGNIDLLSGRLDQPPVIDFFGGSIAVSQESFFTTGVYGINGAYGQGWRIQAGQKIHIKEWYVGLILAGSFKFHDEDSAASRARWERERKERMRARLKRYDRPDQEGDVEGYRERRKSRKRFFSAPKRRDQKTEEPSESKQEPTPAAQEDKQGEQTPQDESTESPNDHAPAEAPEKTEPRPEAPAEPPRDQTAPEQEAP